MTTSAKDFHRLSAVFPADYFDGGLPVDHDWINDPSANGDDGSPAPVIADANSKRSGGPNEGSYFVGWGDDANSGNFNRGLVALAQNTDYIDNILNKKIAIPQRADAAAPGAPVSSLSFSADTYIEGWSTDAASIDRLFSIVNDEDEEIIVGGSKVRITTLTGPGPSDVWASGSFTATVSPAIPTGVAYRVYYAVAGRLAALPRDAFTSIKVRGAEEVSAKVENLFRLLQGNNYEWDTTPWEGSTSIYSLVHRGLHQLYSRTSVYTAEVPIKEQIIGNYSTSLNTAGSGAWFYLTGPGIAGTHSVDSFDYGDLYCDPFSAVWKALTTTSLDGNYTQFGMSLSDPLNTTVGYLFLGQRKSGATAAEMSAEGGKAPGFAAFMAGANTYHDYTATDLFTRIDGQTACTVSISGDDVQVVTGDSNTYFASGSFPNYKTGIAEGTDIIVLQNVSDPTKMRAYVVTTVVSASTIKCRALDGGSPADFTGNCKLIRWVRPYCLVGDGAPQFREYAVDAANKVLLRNFMVLQPPKNHTSATVDALDTRYNGAANAYFGALDNTATSKALAWGGYYHSGTSPGGGMYYFSYHLAGNGDINAAHVHGGKGFSHDYYHYNILSSTEVEIFVDVAANPTLDIKTTGTVNLKFTNIKRGQVFYLYFRRKVGDYYYDPDQTIDFGSGAADSENDGSLTIVVEGSSDSTYQLPTPGPSDEMHIFKCEFVWWIAGSSRYLVIRHEAVVPA